MSTQTPLPTDEHATRSKEASSGGFARWHRRVLGFCLVIFALEIGLFLIIFPWRPEWQFNWLPVNAPRFFRLWMSDYLRGAVSGLGALNVYVALAELYRQLKALFSR